MTIKPLIFAVVGLVVVACEPGGQGGIESNDLGITELEVRHERVQDERLLTLRGFDQSGATVATAVLRTGMVLYGADVPEELHPGTELTVTIGEQYESFVSPDRVPHVINQRLSSGVGTFVRLHAVASEIDHEAGIRFAPPQGPASSDEIAFAAEACSGSRFPTNKGGANQCCQDGADTYHVNPATLAVANRRTYPNVYPSIPVCRDSHGDPGCTTNCMYGPCGSAVISVKGTNGNVFQPTNPTVCGWDDGGPGGLGVDYSPEHYTTQLLSGPLTATCACSLCNADGTALCGFHDDFTRTSGLGTSWENSASGTFSTDGTHAVSNSPNNSNFARIIFTYPTNDLEINSSISSSTTTYSDNSVIARGGGTGYNFVMNRYEAAIDTQQGGSIGLWRINNENTSYTLGNAPVAITPGTFYPVRLVATGTNPVHLEAWVGGVKKVVYDDYSASRLTSGHTGIGTYDSSTKWDFIDVMPTLPQGSPPPPPPSGSPFIDDFTTTPVPQLGTNWVVASGTFTVSNGRVVTGAVVNRPDSARVEANVGSNNYAITAVMSVPTDNEESGIVVRSQATSSVSKDTYIGWIDTQSGGKVGLYRENGWSETNLSTVLVPITAGTFYTLKVVATGTNPVHLEVWLDGVKKIDYNDSSGSRITTGGHGIISYALVGGVQYESYRADAL